MTKENSVDAKKCITPKFRVSFPNLFKPKAFEQQEAKYSITMLFPKSVDLAATAGGKNSLKQAALNAAAEKWGADRAKWPKNLRLPFRDGNEKSEMQGYAEHVFVSASSKMQPGLVDEKLLPILNEKDFYPGCYARAELIAFAYDKAGNKGVSFSLQNVQKLSDGEAFSGRKDAGDVFDAVEDTSAKPESYSQADSLGF